MLRYVNNIFKVRVNINYKLIVHFGLFMTMPSNQGHPRRTHTLDRPRNLTFKRDCIWYKHIKIALSVNVFLFTCTSCQLQI